ncbi:putative ankyrin repeat protein [Acanthamoeba castellanii mimivirus]|uniref:Putative ankyrin repeat protein R580 n=5 Tax=Mimivirus TaxID=315393 RepID=YR580_MIMIV|nr:putative ankyrin repeat protein [Acanthamoeba polyphaga mimivirus]Q5UR56.1 RecName: Full=Putative ankyrin repeat protein R580 [Acanthamoeba polyphaga mimivirus]ALR84168.1 ankyrin repeat protein [Niemeyer virus]AMK61954.1 ankyrin repeat-containing protein [Samba virus]AMZ03023.1 putative ankyrin repeat protein [Mimivirus Bombay]BAV61694.1 putative ankyrin repeat protein [Acanthamoeba castellanii mimivirus]AAV50843.1 unknown [Acanthamoeba polyphaga mimivirus]
MSKTYYIISTNDYFDPINLSIKDGGEKTIDIIDCERYTLIDCIIFFCKKESFVIEIIVPDFLTKDKLLCDSENLSLCVVNNIYYMNDISVFDSMSLEKSTLKSLMNWAVKNNYKVLLQKYLDNQNIKIYDLLACGISNSNVCDNILELLLSYCKYFQENETMFLVSFCLEMHRIDIAKTLIMYNSYPSVINKSLNFASKSNMSELAIFLVDNGAEINCDHILCFIRIGDIDTVLYMLCRYDVQKLIDRCHFDLVEAVFNSGSLEMIETFIDFGMKINSKVYQHLKYDSKDTYEILRILLAREIYPRKCSDVLKNAAHICSIDVLKILVDFEFNQKSFDNALVSTINAGKFKNAEYLLFSGANINFNNMPTNCMFKINFQTIKFLIDNNFDLEIHGTLILNKSLLNGYYDCANILIENGVKFSLTKSELLKIYSDFQNTHHGQIDPELNINSLTSDELENLIYIDIVNK